MCPSLRVNRSSNKVANELWQQKKRRRKEQSKTMWKKWVAFAYVNLLFQCLSSFVRLFFLRTFSMKRSTDDAKNFFVDYIVHSSVVWCHRTVTNNKMDPNEINLYLIYDRIVRTWNFHSFFVLRPSIAGDSTKYVRFLLWLAAVKVRRPSGEMAHSFLQACLFLWQNREIKRCSENRETTKAKKLLWKRFCLESKIVSVCIELFHRRDQKLCVSSDTRNISIMKKKKKKRWRRNNAQFFFIQFFCSFFFYFVLLHFVRSVRQYVFIRYIKLYRSNSFIQFSVGYFRRASLGLSLFHSSDRQFDLMEHWTLRLLDRYFRHVIVVSAIELHRVRRL